MKEWKIGDKVYRYEFNWRHENIIVNVFELVEVNGSRGKFVAIDGSEKTLGGSFVYLNPDLLDRVRTKGSTKYVITRSDDMEEASKKLFEYLSVQMRKHSVALQSFNALWRWTEQQLKGDV